MVKKFYDWCLVKANSPHGERALFWIAFAESSFFIFPPDILMTIMVLSAREKWLRFVAIAVIGSVLGGVAGYLIGLGVWELVQGFFYAYIFTPEIFEKVKGLYHQHDFWIVFVAAFTPIPYKVFTITAGVTQVHLTPFILASIVGRGGRFFTVSLLLYLFGPPIRQFIEKYFNYVTIVFTALLIGGFVLLKHLAH